MKKFIYAAIILPISINGYCQKSNIIENKYYQEPAWKPRAILPYDDAINNNFWPASPKVEVDYNDAGFDETRLSKVPAPGIYPRVLITPTDVEHIKAKLALGDKAPAAFKVMWQRVSKLQTPFYALVTNNDTLGRKLAVELVQKIKNLSPKIDEMNKRPDHENIWAVERSIIASGEPNPPSEIWDLLEYDYLHKWMTNEEREMARSLIAKIIKHRISNFLMVPDHFMINNHEGFGMEFIRLMLLIEGQEGFDQKLFDLCVHKADAMLSWFLDKDGMCYESIKGWLNTSAMVAVGLRNRNLMKHSHLRAKMNFFLAAIRWEDGTWHIRDEMRASAFHVIWMMHYFHPTDERLDFLYQSTFSSHSFLTDANAKWPDPVGICTELLLLFADNGITDAAGKTTDWTKQTNIDKLQLPTTWQDSARGYVEVRNSWKKEDLKVGFVCKQDFFYGGHEGSENNRLTLWKDGINWIQDNNMLATKATFLQNMLTIDGKGQHWPPVAGNWLGIKENKQSLMATGDGKMGYSFSKVMQVHPLFYPSAKLPYYQPFTEGNFDLSRDMQVAFQPSTIAFNNGYAHTDYGPWSGETRLTEGYKPFNEVLKAYRTIQVAKGKYPYLLVVDDVQKDNLPHQYDWNISVPLQATLVEASTPEIVFQNTDPSNERINDLIIASRPVEKDSLGKAILKKGEPLCLVRVLWRNTNYGFGVPSLQHFEGYTQINIPANSVSPDFKVLVYPYKYGEPLPTTDWNNDRTQITINFKEQKDVYHFAEGDGGRTALHMKRNNENIAGNGVKPARPVLLVRNKTYNASDYRYTRMANDTPGYKVNGSAIVQFQYPKTEAEIHYTVDGTEPTMSSPVFIQPITISKSCLLLAKTFYVDWPFADGNSSETQAAIFTLQPPLPAVTEKPANSVQGLTVKLFEINTKPYNSKGFFDAGKIMLPNLSEYNSSYTLYTKQFTIPYLSPTQPLEQQAKGFYQFTGWWYARQTGVYLFSINSCGPMSFEIGKQNVVQATSLFHQQQAIRSGEVVLSKGWHPINLIVCDPLFWNANSMEPMPLQISYQIDGNDEQNILPTDIATNTSKPSTEEMVALPAIGQLPLLENGFDLLVYDRTGKRRDNDFMDIEQATPFAQERSSILEAANSRNSVRVYNAYYYATETGMYQFLLPYKSDAIPFLGSTQASCQSMVKVYDKYIAQRGVYGRNLSGKVLLKAGWHSISLRLGTGVPQCYLLLPAGQTIALSAKNMYRPMQVSILPDGETQGKNLYELYDSVPVQLSFSPKPNAAIHYTLDGTIPTEKSAVYTLPIVVSKTCTLKAMAFVNSEPVTSVAAIQLQKVATPTTGSLGILRFDNWDGSNSYYNSPTHYKAWINPMATIVKGRQGKAIGIVPIKEGPKNVDVNVSRGSIKAALKIYGLNLKENALSVSIWFNTSDLTGRLFDKDGYNAFGKRYRTVSCSIANGKLMAVGNKLNGGLVQTHQWQHIVLSATEEETTLYLNGMLIAKGPGTKDINTDALDFFSDMNVQIDQVEIFDRQLSSKEVEKLFISTKK